MKKIRLGTEEGPNRELRHAVHQLRDEVEDLGDAIQSLPTRLGGLDAGLDEVRRAVRQVESRSYEAEATSQDLSAMVKRLAARVEWLERNIRLTADTPQVELDDVDTESAELARVAEAGHVARSALLPPAGRSVLEAAVAAHSTAIRAQVHHRGIALAACEVLADTGRDDGRHAEAVTDLRQAVAGLAEARGRARELAGSALEAVDLLGTDEERQVAVADVIAEGERAWSELQHRLRIRVADAVGEGALLPSWFTSVLGPMPSPQDTKAWMDVATSLLAYRVTYAVTDPILPLGRQPAEPENPRRRAWYQQLRRQFDELQR